MLFTACSFRMILHSFSRPALFLASFAPLLPVSAAVLLATLATVIATGVSHVMSMEG